MASGVRTVKPCILIDSREQAPLVFSSSVDVESVMLRVAKQMGKVAC